LALTSLRSTANWLNGGCEPCASPCLCSEPPYSTVYSISKKVGNLVYALALHFMYYNFCKVHKTVKMTPAMAAGVTDHVWALDEVVALLESK